MARREYPLEALRKLRDERAEAQAQALAKQLTRVAASETVLRDRERLRREQEAETAETLSAERARLASGAASGADLGRVAEFEKGARARIAVLAQGEAEAREQLAKERAAEHELRAELSRLEAEAKLTRNHEAEFHQRHENAALHAEEEAALEQWNARHR
jgi:hypothetical protein